MKKNPKSTSTFCKRFPVKNHTYMYIYIICPRSSDPFYIVTSWTDSRRFYHVKLIQGSKQENQAKVSMRTEN